MQSRVKRTLFIALPLGILIGAAGAFAADPYLDEADGHVDKAIKALHKAYTPSEKSEFGGHGKKALDLLDDVKREIKKAKEYDDAHPTKPAPAPTPTPKPTTDPGPTPKPNPSGGPVKPPPSPSGGPTKPPIPSPHPKK
jgi:outer membrane biosynthesis protein TonB